MNARKKPLACDKLMRPVMNTGAMALPPRPPWPRPRPPWQQEHNPDHLARHNHDPLTCQSVQLVLPARDDNLHCDGVLIRRTQTFVVRLPTKSVINDVTAALNCTVCAGIAQSVRT